MAELIIIFKEHIAIAERFAICLEVIKGHIFKLGHTVVVIGLTKGWSKI